MQRPPAFSEGGRASRQLPFAVAAGRMKVLMCWAGKINLCHLKRNIMPLPMVHLAVVIQLCKQHGRDASPAFLLGSIAPDAIHSRPGTDRNDKQRVHLKDLPDEKCERVQSLFIKYYGEGGEESEFAEGYAAHILTDRLWEETVITWFREEVQAMSEQDQRQLYYDETDQVDFDLYKTVPWREEVWHKLREAEARDFDNLLTSEEIRGWQERTLNWFEKLKEEPGIVPVYITGEVIEDFIQQAVAMSNKYLTMWKAKGNLPVG